MKLKYVPCELNVVEFKVERGFACSEQTMMGTTVGDGFWNPMVTTWVVTREQGQNDFQNQKFQDGGSLNDWNVEF